jgi:hypothetical protein
MTEADVQQRMPENTIARTNEARADGSLTTLVTGILDDAQKLVRQQFEMLKAEVQADMRKSRRAAEFGGIGAVLLTVGFLAIVAAIALFLNEQLHFVLWASFLVTGGFFFLVGVGLAAVCYGILERVSPVPNKSIHALEETLQWKTK